ncbi:UDP-N-acetylmuramoyl-L-alanine--D-glutamate ligase [Aquisalimonas sp. 2447]|uniref:UDP-N-acetylmuramoyl-L-alanine--D-glutamate ligase n=1 Tax=Aquisalimonas sp. 2447 TaxID=2740807 RepID=UPI00143240DE|nr:UDP-N-acetylmuramoyl-L-alanine--D-glutamate ligase [Aquisalimonas sp. 2447]QIT56280.1 UDP-N-acetylmuramoyl-L-alanine--D-glutamate ligase [Aquisalimonas sp. 2447]
MAKNVRTTVVVGLGQTGEACVRFLHRRGIAVAATDSRRRPPGASKVHDLDPAIPLHLGDFDATLLADAAEIVVSPGVSLDEPALRQARLCGVPVISEIELFARQARAPVVAITGSNGKSTVTTLVGEMAGEAGKRAGVGGNLGTPALDLLDDPEPDLYVLELSSFQLETTHSLCPAAAVVLNVSADHMDRHGDVETYAAIKARVYHGDGVMVVNRDDARVAAMARRGRAVRPFGLAAPSQEGYGILRSGGRDWLARDRDALLPVDSLALQGRHNQLNALAALALAESVGLPSDACLRVLQRFTGLPHRMQWLGDRAGLRWINDSKATNVGAALAAVEGLDGPLVLIAGGQGKGADFTPLVEPLARKARAVVLVGDDAPILARALGDRVPQVRARDMDDAVARACEVAQVGDTVLLSPACASFDQYAGYEARGRAFADAVGRLVP